MKNTQTEGKIIPLYPEKRSLKQSPLALALSLLQQIDTQLDQHYSQQQSFSAD